MKYLGLISLTGLFIYVSCNYYSKETRIFNNYLNDNFQSIKFKDTSIVILIPTQKCYSCFIATNSIVTKMLKCTNCYIICPNAECLETVKNINLLIDNSGNVDRLNLGVNSTTIILYKLNKIVYIKGINMSNYMKLYSDLKPYFIE